VVSTRRGRSDHLNLHACIVCRRPLHHDRLLSTSGIRRAHRPPRAVVDRSIVQSRRTDARMTISAACDSAVTIGLRDAISGLMSVA
jgi:hypothetical protein